MPEQDANLDPKIVQIVNQYRQIAAAYGELFGEIYKRTEYEEWRMDGIGSCRIPTHNSLAGIDGIAKDAIIQLREQVSESDTSERVELAEGAAMCRYHRAGKGCVLTDLKSPMCISHIESRDEVAGKFGIEQMDFAMDVFKALRKVMWTKVSDLSAVNPDENNQFVSNTVVDIHALILRVVQVPEIDPARRIKFIPSE